MGNKLFEKTPEGILLKCFSESEAYLALSNIQSGECGAHQVGHKNEEVVVSKRNVLAYNVEGLH